MWSYSFIELDQWFPTLGNPDVFGLQLPEITASAASDGDFWEQQTKNTWVVINPILIAEISVLGSECENFYR